MTTGEERSERPRVGLSEGGLVTLMAWSRRGEAVTLKLSRDDALVLADELRSAATPTPDSREEHAHGDGYVSSETQRDAYVRDEDGNVAWHAISEEGDLCPVCHHPTDTHDGPAYDGCTWVSGYGHLEGDHLCGCPLTPRITLDA